MSAPLLAGVELGGTKCVALLATGPADVRETVRVPTTTPDETLGRLRETLAGWRERHGFAALGVASFGPVELARGRIGGTPKPGWSGADLTALGDELGVPVAIDTDVNGAALAEGRWGAAQGLRSWAYVTVGTGVGVGGVVDGRPVRGLGHSEAGHMLVPRSAPDWPGACPFHGDCVEGLASGAALRARLGRGAEDLPAADSAWDEAVEALAGLFHNLALTILPERILVGGGVVTSRPELLVRIRARLADSLGGYAHGARVAQQIDRYLASPALGAMAGPLGAIALAADALARRSG